MRIFSPGQLLWQSSLVAAVYGFANFHAGDHPNHQGLHKKCPFADIPDNVAADHEKRFLFDTMRSPVDSKQQPN